MIIVVCVTICITMHICNRNLPDMDEFDVSQSTFKKIQ